MMKKVQQYILNIRRKLLEYKKNKNWNFDNIEQFLEYCESTETMILEKKYFELCKINRNGVKKLERQVKGSSAKSRIINIKHLNVMTSVIKECASKGLEYTNPDVLYIEITKYLQKICEEKYESYDYIDLFYEMYALNLENPGKIKDLVNKYLISVGKLAS